MNATLLNLVDPTRRRGGILNTPWKSPMSDPDADPVTGNGPLYANSSTDMPRQPQPMGRGMNEGDQPAPSTVAPVVSGSTLMDKVKAVRPDTSYLTKLESEQSQLTQPPSWGQTLRRAGALAAPVALAGVLGGHAGVTGALEGESKEMDEQRTLAQKRAEMLGSEISQERGRLNQSEIEQMRIEAEAPLHQAQIAQANAQAQNLQDEIRQRGLTTPATLAHLGAETSQLNANAANLQSEAEMRRMYGTTSPDEFERTFYRQNQRMPSVADREAYNETNKSFTVPTYTPLLDDKGNIIGRWNNRAGKAEVTPQPPGPPLRKTAIPGQVLNREVQSQTIQNVQNNLLPQVDKIAKFLGPGKGRITKLEQMWGNPDPDVQEFANQLAGYIALQPGFHQFRGVQALQEWQKAANIKLTPVALKAAIKGIGDIQPPFQQAVDQTFGQGQQPSAQGAITFVRDPKTNKLVRSGQ